MEIITAGLFDQNRICFQHKNYLLLKKNIVMFSYNYYWI